MKNILSVLFLGLCIGSITYAADEKIIVLETNQGTIEIKLMPGVAPKACENFIKLAEKGYYNG
jgi:hypothetical protein